MIREHLKGCRAGSKADLELEMIWQRDDGWQRKEKRGAGSKTQGPVQSETERQGVRQG